MRTRLMLGVVVAGFVLAGCSSGDDDAGDELVTDDSLDERFSTPNAEFPLDLAEQLASVPLPDSDMALPAEIPDVASGAPGFTHFVFQEIDGAVTPVLVEGPAGEQVRCQDPALPCSHAELKELYESGAEIPPELGIDRETLGQMLDEMALVSFGMGKYMDPNDACAAGFVAQPSQIPNMGAHFYHYQRILDGQLIMDEPDILMFEYAGEGEPGGAFRGGCRDGEWKGDPNIRLAGASFIQPPYDSPDHPEGFAGPFDNWHVHYNLCNTSFPTKDRQSCEDRGGMFLEALGWMVHTWVPPCESPDGTVENCVVPDWWDTENQNGIFAQWHSGLWPVIAPVDLQERWRTDSSTDNVSVIADFEFEDMAIEAGTEVVFANSDGVPHTATGGSADGPDGSFDTGILRPGATGVGTFDEPGEYPFYCLLHPRMTGTVTVG